MGLPCFNLTTLPLLLTRLYLLLIRINKIFTVSPTAHNNTSDLHPRDDRPSPSLVPLPFHFVSQSIKANLLVVQYGDVLKRRGAAGAASKNLVCAVCMNYMQLWEDVRELPSCDHVFHRECLDTWIDRGGSDSCPLCRSKLLPHRSDQLGGDPWRKERMIYLFGEDFEMASS